MRYRPLRVGESSNRRVRTLVFLVLTISLLAGAPTTAASLDGADQAFSAEDYAEALRLYEEVLVAEPDNQRALMRSGLLLSWENRLSEALQRYDRLLQLDPDHRRATTERAKVLSWDGQYAAARQSYLALLELSPDDAGLLVGVAQSYAWSGRLAPARKWFDRALASDPFNKEAGVGRAYVDLWSGNPGRAHRRARSLAERHPDNRDVKQLIGRTHEATAPWVRTAVDRLSDTDDNTLWIYGVSAAVGLPAGMSLHLAATRHDMSDPNGDATIDTLAATLHIAPGPGQQLAIRAGVDRREDLARMSESDAIGGLTYTWGLDRLWQFGIDVGRDGLRYSPLITDNGILMDRVGLFTRGRVGERWRLHLNVGLTDFSEAPQDRTAMPAVLLDNRRDHLSTGCSYRILSKPMILETGYLFRYMDYERDLDGGYFDPSGFNAHLLQLRGRGDYGKNKNTYSFSVDAGIQSFTLAEGSVNENEVDNDTVLAVAGTLGFPLGRQFNLELFATWGDYAAQNASGFESRQVGLRFKWQARP